MDSKTVLERYALAVIFYATGVIYGLKRLISCQTLAFFIGMSMMKMIMIIIILKFIWVKTALMVDLKLMDCF